MNKLRIGVVFGGRSAEHEVSLISAYNVMKELDRTKYEIFPIGVTKDGVIEYFESEAILNFESPKTVKLDNSGQKIYFASGGFFSPAENKTFELDAVFPILHGTYGEDGAMQGLLEIMNLPYVGAGILGSAVGMDKDAMKKILKEAGVPIGKFQTVARGEKIDYASVESALGLPVFVKPANAGSSVGISKARNEEELNEAISEAFRFDNKILIEEEIVGAEIEVSVLGNEKPEASLPGKVIPRHEFYSYEAKYLDENGADFEIPAKLNEDEIFHIQKVAIQAYCALSAEGMARVDGFLAQDGRFIINEINTIPGFTKISMYPKLWEVSGLSYSRLLDKLIDLALDRAEKRRQVLTNFVG